MTPLLATDPAALGQFLLIGLVSGLLYALIALGYTMVYGIVELINFAHGDLFMLGCMLALQLCYLVGATSEADAGTGAAYAAILLMLAAAPVFCAGLNVAVDRLVYKPLRTAPKLAPLVSAIGVSFVFMGVGLFWRGATDVSFPKLLLGETNLLDGVRLGAAAKELVLVAVAVTATTAALALLVRQALLVRARRAAARSASVQDPPAARPVGVNVAAVVSAIGAALSGTGLVVLVLGSGVVFTSKDLMVVLVTLPTMVALTLFVRYTAIGKAMRATAQNPTAAQLMGINVDRVIAATFALGGALAGVGAVVYCLYFNTVNYLMGFQNGVYAFTAAVLGGIGNIPGAVLGGVVIGLVKTLGGAYIGPEWSEALIFAILVVILIFRPNGLLGARTREKV